MASKTTVSPLIPAVESSPAPEAPTPDVADGAPAPGPEPQEPSPGPQAPGEVAPAALVWGDPGPIIEIPGFQMTARQDHLSAALARAQGEMRAALKDSSNPHFKSSYADLASVWDAWRAAGSRNGLAVVQSAQRTERGVRSCAMLKHESGQWIAPEPLTLPLSKDDAQGTGSAITYGRRYVLSALVGVAPDEDDGEAAVGRGEAALAPSKPQPKPANGKNGAPKSFPAAEKAARATQGEPAQQPTEDPLKALKWEVIDLLAQVVGTKQPDGTYDVPSTMAMGETFLPHANAWRPKSVPMKGDGRADMSQASEAQLGSVKEWLLKELAAQQLSPEPPF